MLPGFYTTSRLSTMILSGRGCPSPNHGSSTDTATSLVRIPISTTKATAGNIPRRTRLRPPGSLRRNPPSSNRSTGKVRSLTVGTWNGAAILRASRELDAAKVAAGVDILFLTEVELPPNTSVTLQGFTTFYSATLPGFKIRILAFVDNDLMSHSNVTPLSSSHLDIWLELDLGNRGCLVVGGVYCQWSACEAEDLHSIHATAAAYSSSYKRCVLVGDFNLEVARLNDPLYSKAKMARLHLDEMSAAGFSFIGPTSPTFFSYGLYSNSGGRKTQSQSAIDHV